MTDKRTILCIDDDQDILDILKAILTANGYEVVGALSAEQGLRAFKQSRPDLIIVDLMMEEIDAGTNLVKQLKAAGSGAPVYMLSSVGDSLSMLTDYGELGLSGVFQKPIDSDKILSTIRAKLGQ